MSLSDIEEPTVEEFKPSGKLLAAIWSIAVVNLACALDATSVALALPVQNPSP